MSAAGHRFTALILAGNRNGDDAVARQAGLTHRALVPVAGIPMLLRVMRTLRGVPSIGSVALCIERSALDQLDRAVVAELLDGVSILAPGRSPSASVERALRQLPEAVPLLVTTADHPLLTPAMVEHFCAAAPANADVAVAMANAETIRREHPAAVRTYYRFAGQSYSGCNLFLLRGAAGGNAAAFWSKMEGYRKRPWRLVAAIGPMTLLRFVVGALTLESALRRLSRIIGATVQVVDMPFAEAAIDVDKPADLALAETVLANRGR